MDLKRDIHIIALDNGSLIYSPLKRAIFLASDESCEIIKSYLSADIQILKK